MSNDLFSLPTCWKQSSPSCNTDYRYFTLLVVYERCVLSQWRCFLWDSVLSLTCTVDPKGPTHRCINHHWGWERGNKNPRLGLNPAITQHARRDVWLDSLNYSHHGSLTALNNDRFLSSLERRAIRLTHMHLWHIALKLYNVMVHRDVWNELHLSHLKKKLTAQLHTSLLWSLSNGKSPEECRVRVPAASSPHTGMVR